MQHALAQWHASQAAEQIAEAMLEAVEVGMRTGKTAAAPSTLANSPAANIPKPSDPPGLSRNCRPSAGETVPMQGRGPRFRPKVQVTV